MEKDSRTITLFKNSVINRHIKALQETGLFYKIKVYDMYIVLIIKFPVKNNKSRFFPPVWNQYLNIRENFRNYDYNDDDEE